MYFVNINNSNCRYHKCTIATIPIVDISNSICQYQQIMFITDITNNANCWYRQFELSISTIGIKWRFCFHIKVRYYALYCISLAILSCLSWFPSLLVHKLSFLCWRAVKCQSINRSIYPNELSSLDSVSNLQVSKYEWKTYPRLLHDNWNHRDLNLATRSRNQCADHSVPSPCR